MVLLQGIGVILLFIAVPMLVGDYIRRFIKIEYSLATNYVIGMITMWALFQVWAVPLILLKSNFLLLVAVWGICLGILTVLQLVYLWQQRDIHQRVEELVLSRKQFRKKILQKKEKGLWEKQLPIAAVTIMCLLIVQQGYMYAGYMHLDADDSRFVVNALEAQQNHTMLLTNPMTGVYEDTWVGDLPKDVASPWSIYIAAVGTLTGIHATVMAHTILPLFLLLFTYAGYWLLAKELFGKNIINQGVFVIVAALMNEFFYSSLYTEGTFLLTRVWQGKAAVAGMMIPLLFLLLLMSLRYREEKRSYILLWMGMFAICLMSGMGIILGAILVGAFGLTNALVKRDRRLLLNMVLTCIPNIVYGLIYFKLK